MRDTAYLSMGSVSMGIGGSIVNPDFFQEYLGMRNESVDMTEFTRRMDRGIYDPEEFERALKWVKENVKEGFDHNREDLVLSREEKDRQWEFVIKMFMIGRDLMVGNPRLAELGFEEEAVGHHALVAGFKVNVSGQTIFQMEILWKLSSILSLTGMVFENHLYLRQRMIH